MLRFVSHNQTDSTSTRYLPSEMVFEGVQQQTCSGRKRKLKREDSFNSVREGSRLKEIKGEKDLIQMDQSVEPMDRKGEKELNQMDQSVESMDRTGEQDLNQMDQNVESMDRISQLPNHVIHHILSQLRNVKDAIRMSTLSRRWRSLWHSFSVLVFDERRFTAGIGREDSTNKGKIFRDYVSNSLQTHLERNLYIQKLVLHVTTFDREAAPHVDQWLSVARAKNIKELDLHVGIKHSKHYTLPQTVFSSKTLTGLRLSGCKLETCNNIMLPHLRKLYLRKINLVEHIAQNLISRCHSIEDLRFIQCSGLKRLQVSNLLQLNRVEIHHCNQLKRVDLSAPNLHTFWFCAKKSTPCKVNLEGCKSLRRLTLEHPQVTRDFYEHQISKFPLLEKLDLSISNRMKHVKISNPQLQRIVLKGWNKLGTLTINAPNLLSFEYKDETMPSIQIHPPCLTDAKLSFEPKGERHGIVYGDQFWFLAREFINMFDPKGYKLVLHSNKNIVIHENLNNIRLPPLPDMSFEIIKSSACIEDVLYGLLWKLHPVTLSIISPPDSKFPMQIVYAMLNKEEFPICCQYTSIKNKCWRHFLRAIEFEDLDDDDENFEADEDKRNPSRIWRNWLQTSYGSLQCQMTNIRLHWNARPHVFEIQETL